MKTMLTSLVVLVFASSLALAETWTGRLVDARCASQQNSAACTPTSSTTAFAVQVSGKTLRLDAEGSKKATEALKAAKSGADRAKDPNAPADPVTATVQGTMNGDEIKVDSIEIH